ncbi:hypothetical protein CQA49_08115 [Helicobacter sp. MIT 00-7814]|uniref:hypothetical protein n=1 Tax=unclassified Helicobacter TaxID=2593540 RepID=UPI000E1FABC0|nr:MULTISPECIES: hypothetical protein [unclassified Helicobacter]RDU51718.1 hypothetical protein CQA37_09390 [Helicobacter sp. MIT 99-10781]RDU52570.1 hypothetical protein CQA49_08115 [Helicobacter sp. MIT 00-7814]
MGHIIAIVVLFGIAYGIKLAFVKFPAKKSKKNTLLRNMRALSIKSERAQRAYEPKSQAK